MENGWTEIDRRERGGRETSWVGSNECIRRLEMKGRAEERGYVEVV